MAEGCIALVLLWVAMGCAAATARVSDWGDSGGSASRRCEVVFDEANVRGTSLAPQSSATTTAHAGAAQAMADSEAQAGQEFGVEASTRLKLQCEGADSAAVAALRVCGWSDVTLDRRTCAAVDLVSSTHEVADHMAAHSPDGHDNVTSSQWEVAAFESKLTAGLHSMHFAVTGADDGAEWGQVHVNFAVGTDGTAVRSTDARWCSVLRARGTGCDTPQPPPNPRAHVHRNDPAWFYSNGPLPRGAGDGSGAERYALVLSSVERVRSEWPTLLQAVASSELCVEHAELLELRSASHAGDTVRRLFGFARHARREIGYHTGRLGPHAPFLLLLVRDDAPVYVRRDWNGVNSWLSARPYFLSQRMNAAMGGLATYASPSGIDGLRDLTLLVGRTGQEPRHSACLSLSDTLQNVDASSPHPVVAAGENGWPSVEAALDFARLAAPVVALRDNSLPTVIFTDHGRAVWLAMNAIVELQTPSSPVFVLSVPLVGCRNERIVVAVSRDGAGSMTGTPGDAVQRMVHDILESYGAGGIVPEQVPIVCADEVAAPVLAAVAEVLSPPRAAPLSGSVRGAIVSAAYSLTWHKLAPFVVSARRVGFSGPIVLFVHSDLDAFTRERFDAYDVEAVEVSDEHPYLLSLAGSSHIERLSEGVGIKAARYLVAHEWLVANGERLGISHVLHSDSADVFFQHNPFDWADAQVSGGFIHPDALYAFEEARLQESGVRAGEMVISTMGTQVHNQLFLSAYPDEVRAALEDEAVLCSGTTIGSLQRIATYLKRMREEIRDRHREFAIDGSDQGVHNVLLRVEARHNSSASVWGPRGTVRYEVNGKGAVRTLGVEVHRSTELPCDVVLPLDAMMRVLNDDGRVVPVIHQYNRHSTLGELIRRWTTRTDVLTHPTGLGDSCAASAAFAGGYAGG